MARDAAPQVNTTPLIDVLLVLLVLLVVTLPRPTHRIALEVPAGAAAHPLAPEIRIEIDFDGRVFWNGTHVPDEAHLQQWFGQAAAAPGMVRIIPDRHVRYERVAQVLASAKKSHVTRLALASVSD
ncbi:MAG TPA: biopolymer transporter ExbD [Steroidobacteraceae bacterium]|jgi:biopolymer transport protein ExbD